MKKEKYKYRIGVFVCQLVVVTQWQIACALCKLSWVRFPVATKYFLFFIVYKEKKPVKERKYT